ncbi:complement receptor type 1-like [Candoia aspera]|uniref:complement receptor type 1-like n=1 Tax=Candoia aspera TaxID=51853 RepID=UPI002FD846C0
MFGNFFSHLGPRIWVLFPLFSGILGDCSPPPALKFAKPYKPIKSSYKPFESVVYECLPGYEQNHSKKYITTCFPDTGWNHIEEFCERGCETPQETRFTVVEHYDLSFYSVGSVVNHICHRSAEHIPGHPKRPAITCLSNYTWSPVPVFCKGKSCGDPGKPENGDRIILTDFLLRAEVNFICNEEYQLIGSPTSQCLPRGLFNNTVVWKPEPPICSRLTCPPPPGIMNGNYTGGKNGSFPLNSVVTYICDPGFSLFGDHPLHCITEDNKTGIWRGSVPECKGNCPPPDLPPHASVKEVDRKETYSAGTVLQLECIPGYEYIPGKKRSTTCLDTNEWLNLSELCQGRQCPIPRIENGRIKSMNELRLGDEVILACNDGFRMIGGSTRQCVLKSGMVDWNSDLPYCQRIPCARPPLISNGRYDPNPSDEYDAGTIVIYRCDADYSLIGNSTITCTVAANGVDGTWDSPAPECKKVKCRRPNIQDGRVEDVFQASYSYNSRISFRCNSGYTLVGAAFVKCDADSTWNPPVPSCIERVAPTPTKPARPPTPAVPPTPPIPPMPGTVPPEDDEAKEAPTSSTPTETTPTDESGYGKTVGIAIGTVIAGIALAILIFTAVKKRKSNPRPSSSGTYCVASEKEMALEEKQTKDVQDLVSKFTKKKQVLLPKSGSPVAFVIAETATGAMISACTLNLLFSAAFLAAPSGNQDSCGYPPRIVSAELMDEYKEKDFFPVGSTVKYKCRPGYMKIPRTYSITCNRNQQWSKVLELCQRKPCGHPGEPEGGRLLVTGDFLFGSTVNYQCEQGYRLIGKSSRKCIISNNRMVWTDQLPHCGIIPCFPPPSIPHGKHNGNHLEDFFYGIAVTYTCDKGYPLIGNASIHCTTKDGINGEWSGSAYCGVMQCASPQIKNGRIVAGISSTYRYSQKVSFECTGGHKMVGSREIHCQVDGTWHPPVPLCERVVQCQPPPDIQNGTRSNQEAAVFPSGMLVKYTCDPGYALIGEATIHCTDAGRWSSPAPNCEVATSCVTPEIHNGKIQSREVITFTETITFECNPGYNLKGNHTIQCQSDNTWDSPVPICVREVECKSPPNIQNGAHSNQEVAVFKRGMCVKYTCDRGYTLIGDATMHCTDSGTWTSPAPHCEKSRCPFPPSIANGNHDGLALQMFASETSVTYSCDPGYLLIGKASVTCTPSGIWSRPVPSCEAMHCPPPPKIIHGKHLGEDFTYGKSVIYICDAGYSHIGNLSITCIWNSSNSVKWSEAPRCQGCLAPQSIANGKRDKAILGDFSYGSSVTYHCDPGYSLIGAPTVYCQTSGTWDQPAPQCKSREYMVAAQLPDDSHMTKDGNNEIEKATGSFRKNTTLSQSNKITTKGLATTLTPGLRAKPDVQRLPEQLNGGNHTDLQKDAFPGGRHCNGEVVGSTLPPLPSAKKAETETLIQTGANVTLQCENGYVRNDTPIQSQQMGWDTPVPVCTASKQSSYNFATIGFGSLAGILLLFLIFGGVLWIMLLQKEKRKYTYEAKKIYRSV